jgi:hypothetical protein
VPVNSLVEFLVRVLQMDAQDHKMVSIRTPFLTVNKDNILDSLLLASKLHITGFKLLSALFISLRKVMVPYAKVLSSLILKSLQNQTDRLGYLKHN